MKEINSSRDPSATLRVALPARPPAAPGAQRLRAGNAAHPPAVPSAQPMQAGGLGSVAGGWAGNGEHWYVLHVRPRCEKKMAAYCSTLPLQHYLPLRVERKKYQRRRVEVWKPLFPGYIFARFRPEQRISVLQSGQIARILEVKDQIKFINEIEQIRKALGTDPGLHACPAIATGMTVRITAGPFQGLEGIVIKAKGQFRVIINVDMIGQGVAIEADEDVLECL